MNKRIPHLVYDFCLRLTIMPKGYKCVFSFFIVLTSFSNAPAQDPIFSQFYLSPLQLNPGLTGLTEDPRFSANYRIQFPGFNNAYRTYALSYDQYFPYANIGAGFWLL